MVRRSVSVYIVVVTVVDEPSKFRSFPKEKRFSTFDLLERTVVCYGSSDDFRRNIKVFQCTAVRYALRSRIGHANSLDYKSFNDARYDSVVVVQRREFCSTLERLRRIATVVIVRSSDISGNKKIRKFSAVAAGRYYG